MTIEKCPFHSRMRPELEQLPAQMAGLPLDKRGYPVPWFVAWVKGEPEFRAMDSDKWRRAVGQKLCWVCGGRLGVHLAFVVGPMCGINRVSSEPPSHLACAQWSARNCPFLTLRMKKRAEDDLINNETLVKHSPGLAITRNPGVTLVWLTKSYSVFGDGRGGKLLRIGEPSRVEFWSHGRLATRAEVEESVRTGLPTLERAARLDDAADGDDGVAMGQLASQKLAFEALYPAEASGDGL